MCMVLIFSFIDFRLSAQPTEDPRAEARVESLAGQEEDATEHDAEQMGIGRRVSLRLNLMDREELIRELDLSPAEADALLNYRTRFGAFIDPMELQAVPGWSLDLVRRVLPLVRMDTVLHLVPAMQERLEGGGQQLLLRMGSVLERARGYVRDSLGHRAYAGSSLRSTLQYRFRYRSSLDAGLRMEKDAGETWLTRGHLPDQLSAYVSARDLGPISTIVVGDLEVGFAQGLVVWQGMAFRKGANTMEVMRSGPVFKVHSGSDENRYTRGVAIGMHRKAWSLDLFAGRTPRDAHMDSTGGERYFTGFQTSGLHRTRSELNGRKSLLDLAGGGRLSYSKRSVWIGLNMVGHHFSGSFRGGDAPYARYGFSGDRLLNMSVDHHIRAGPIHIYGEWALDRNRHVALTEGLLCSPGPRVDLVLQGRMFSRSYQGLHESPFAEGSKAQNEAGIYMGMEWRPLSGILVSAYVDRYRFPWLRYGVDGPSDGMDALVRFSWRPAKTTECYGQFSWEMHPHDAPGTDPFVPGTVGEARYRVRMHLEHALDRSIVLRIRAEYSGLRVDRREQGFLGFVDLSWKDDRKLTRIMSRLLWVSTDGYGSRIYAYESALPGMYAILPHSGEGFQWSFQVVRRLSGQVESGFGMRQNITQSNDYQGSSSDMILGRRKTEWNLLIRSSF